MLGSVLLDVLSEHKNICISYVLNRLMNLNGFYKSLGALSSPLIDSFNPRVMKLCHIVMKTSGCVEMRCS